MRSNSTLSSITSLVSIAALYKVTSFLYELLKQERESSRRQQTELLNRLASTNWGTILTNSESVPEMVDPLKDPNEYEDELDPDKIISYIDLEDDYKKLDLPNPAEVN